MRKIGVIGLLNARRFVRDRMNLFFAFVFPIALIVVIGLQFGDDTAARLGVVNADGATATEIVKLIGDGRPDATVDIVRVSSDHDPQAKVDAGELDAAMVFPSDLDQRVNKNTASTITLVSGRGQGAQQLTALVEDALVRAAAEPTAVATAVDLGANRAQAQQTAEQLARVIDRVTVRTVTTGDRLFPVGMAGFDVAAPNTLVLFMFVNVLAGSAALIETRRLGVSSRMMSTPTSLRVIIVGEALGRLLIGFAQGLYILVATWLLFGVNWGDPVGAAAVIVAVGAAAAGAAMCFGTFFSQPDQASTIGIVVALSFAALGGAMLPIELFSPTLASVARFTPHYWAINAFAQLIRHNGSVADIVPQLGVLAGFAAVFLLIAAWRMRVVLTRGE